jgi:putative addiction module component (TIGR02574 family)
MSNVSAEVLTLALQLPQSERAMVVHELLLSLEDEPFDADAEAAWQAEIERRLQDFDDGKATALDANEAIAEIRQSLRKRRRA